MSTHVYIMAIWQCIGGSARGPGGTRAPIECPVSSLKCQCTHSKQLDQLVLSVDSPCLEVASSTAPPHLLNRGAATVTIDRHATLLLSDMDDAWNVGDDDDDDDHDDDDHDDDDDDEY